MRATSVKRALTVAIAVLLPVAVAGLLVPLRAHVRNVDLALVLVLAVLGAGVLAGRVAGVASAVSAALAYDLLLTHPYGSLRINEGQDVATTLLLAAVGLTAATLVDRVERHATRAAAAQRSLDRLEHFVELASGSESHTRQITLACAELAALLDLKACRYEDGEASAADVRFAHGKVVVPATAMSGLPGRVVLAVHHRGVEVGHFVLVFPHPSIGLDVPITARHAAVAIADTVGANAAYDHRPRQSRTPPTPF